MKKKSVRSRGIKKSSNYVFWWLRRILGPLLCMRYGYKFNRKTSKGIKRPCLILSNHQTSYDQFAVGLGFKFGINFVASNQIFGHGFGSRLMQKFTQPIPFNKGSSDPNAIKKMLEVVKQGGTVGMFPSGSRSFYGDECPILPGIGKLAKLLRVQIVLVNLVGGYFTKARWKIKPGKGKPRGEVKRIISPEELKELSAVELEQIITTELSHNEYEWQRQNMVRFKGRRRCEGLERVLFYCPSCCSFDSLSAKKTILSCTKCDMKVELDEYGFLKQRSNAEKCPDTILEWGRLQEQKLSEVDFERFEGKPIFQDGEVELYKIEDGVKKTFLSKGDLSLFLDHFEICGEKYYLKDCREIVVHSGNRLAFFCGESEFVVYMQKRANALKYAVYSARCVGVK